MAEAKTKAAPTKKKSTTRAASKPPVGSAAYKARVLRGEIKE